MFVQGSCRQAHRGNLAHLSDAFIVEIAAVVPSSQRQSDLGFIKRCSINPIYLCKA